MFSKKKQQSDTSEGFVQMIHPEEDATVNVRDIPDKLLILPIKNTVLFPDVVLPITVTRQKSIRLIKKAYQDNKIIGVVTQRNKESETPSLSDLHSIGTVARIIKVLILPDGNTTIIIQGKLRFMIKKLLNHEPYMKAAIVLCKENEIDKKNFQIKALTQSLKDSASNILKLNPEIPREAQEALDNINGLPFLIHFLSSNLNVEANYKQNILEIDDIIKRGELLLKYMLKEIQVLEIKNEIQKKVRKDIDKQQRDYVIRQQIKTLQDELGLEDQDDEIVRLYKQSKQKKMA